MHVGHRLLEDDDLRERASRLLHSPLDRFPVLTAKIKLTWRCNLKCRFCSVWQKPGHNLPEEKVKETLSELKKQGLEKVHFSGGEILLYPAIKEIICYARELGLQVNMTTNGTLIDKEMARFLINERVHSVVISLDSPRKSRHNAIRGEGAFEKTVKALELLQQRKLKKGRGPKIAVNTVITKDVVPDLNDMYQFLRKLEVDAWRLLPLDSDNKKELPTVDDWMKITDQCKNWSDLLTRLPIDLSSERSCQRAAKGKYAGVYYPQNRCYAPWFNLFIDADGMVYPCCMGKSEIEPYGNINQQKLSELLDSQHHREIKLSFAAGHMYPICERCDDLLEENEVFNSLDKRQN